MNNVIDKNIQAVELCMEIASSVLKSPADKSTPEALLAWAARLDEVSRSLDLASNLLKLSSNDWALSMSAR